MRFRPLNSWKNISCGFKMSYGCEMKSYIPGGGCGFFRWEPLVGYFTEKSPMGRSVHVCISIVKGMTTVDFV